jgi:hypothetical protein
MRDHLHVDGERAVLLAARRRDGALRHLALHQVDRAPRARQLERLEEDRRRDVVGDVAGEHEVVAGEVGEADLEHVGLDHREARVRGVALAELGGEAAGRAPPRPTRPARRTRRSVRAPRPGPISSTVSVPVSSSASTIASSTVVSRRKCCPRRLRVGG